MIIIFGIIVILAIVGTIKLFCRDVTLTVCLIIILSYPLVFLAIWVVNYASQLGNTVGSSLDALKIFGFGLVGIIVLISMIIGWFKKRAEKDFQGMYDQTRENEDLN